MDKAAFDWVEWMQKDEQAGGCEYLGNLECRAQFRVHQPCATEVVDFEKATYYLSIPYWFARFLGKLGLSRFVVTRLDGCRIERQEGQSG